MNGTITHLMEVAETLMRVKASWEKWNGHIELGPVKNENDEMLELDDFEKHHLIEQIKRQQTEEQS